MPDLQSKRPICPESIIDPATVPYSDPSYRGVLPHLHKPGCTYFVTFCLADVAGQREMVRQRFLESDEPIDIAEKAEPEPAAGSCILGDPELAVIVEEALLHFQGERYLLSAWCVMPNHVHAVVTPMADQQLATILKSWKGFSARRINRELNRSGRVWQKESFDHIIRNAEHHERYVTYVEQNPVAAGLVERASEWPFSSAHHRSDL